MIRRSVPVLALLLVSCADDPERTPATCVDCGYSVGAGMGLPDGSGGSGGEAASGSGATAGEAVTLTGRVALVDDVGLEAGPLFPDPAAIRVEGQSGASVVGTWDGAEPFSIENVAFGPEVWLLSTPPVNGLALPTLELLDTTQPNMDRVVTADVAVVSQELIDTVLSLLSVPVFRNEEAAQIILRIEDTEGDPLAGVTVIARSAEVVAYGASGSFSDIATETDSSGLVLIANVPATVWPGSLVGVTFAAGALQGGADVRVVTGGVTLERILL